MPLGMEVDLDPGDFVLDGDPAPPPQKGGRSPNFIGPFLLLPNGWMDQEFKITFGTGMGLGPGHTVLDGGPGDFV